MFTLTLTIIFYALTFFHYWPAFYPYEMYLVMSYDQVAPAFNIIEWVMWVLTLLCYLVCVHKGGEFLYQAFNAQSVEKVLRKHKFRFLNPLCYIGIFGNAFILFVGVTQVDVSLVVLSIMSFITTNNFISKRRTWLIRRGIEV